MSPERLLVLARLLVGASDLKKFEISKYCPLAEFRKQLNEEATG